jgi:uncharacterized protein
MKIKISNLSDGIHNFNFDEAVKDIQLSEPFFGNILVDAELNKAHGQLVLSANITAKANFDCDRCTSNFDTTITNSYQMVYMVGMEPEESDSINIAYLPPDADTIVLDGDVRDYAVLAIPMKKLCSEDCKGLCIKCGKNLNEGDCTCNHEKIDDRWLPLMELKNKINNN